MKTVIKISGQISGNFTLKHAVQTSECADQKTSFNGFYLFFQTKKQAKDALKNASKELKNDEPDFYKEGGIGFYNDSLSYDASIAEILDHEIGIDLFSTFDIEF